MTAMRTRKWKFAGMVFLALNLVAIAGFWAWDNMLPLIAGHVNRLDWRGWEAALF